MATIDEQPDRLISRRGWLDQSAAGLGPVALTSLIAEQQHATASGESTSWQSVVPHQRRKARSIIWLFMAGGPSQVDTFDPKPELNKRHGQSYFDELASEVESPAAAGALMKSPYRFAQHGEAGHWISNVLPHLSTCADDLAVIKSMYTTNLTHEPALFKIHGGQEMPGLPALGSWVSYGLGTENQNLPAYVVLDDPLGLPVNQIQNWQAGYLPPTFQGTRFRSTGAPVLNLEREFEEPDNVTEL